MIWKIVKKFGIGDKFTSKIEIQDDACCEVVVIFIFELNLLKFYFYAFIFNKEPYNPAQFLK